MRLFFLLLLLFLPFIEITIFIQVADQIGGWTTLALALLASMVGVSLIRSKGVKTLMLIQQKLAQGEMPAQEVVQAGMLVIAGILLIIPGFLTDFVALILLLPWVQKALAHWVLPRMQIIGTGSAGFGSFGGEDNRSGHRTFDGEFERKDPPTHQGDNSQQRPDDHDQPPRLH
ncbi:FxsA family protein [Plesiomonas shigelloides]